MNKLSKKSYILYGLGVSYFMLDQLFVQWLKYFYLPPSNSLLQPLLPARYIILAFVIMRIADALADPVVGYLSDRTNSKYGRRSIYMMIGGLPLAIAMILFFYPLGTTQFQRFIYFTVIGVIYFIAYTLVGGPYNSLIPDLANTREERLNLSTIQSVFRLLFTALPLILSGVLITRFTKLTSSYVGGFRLMIILFSVLSLVGVYACSLFLQENKLTGDKIKSNKVSFRQTIKQLNNREVILYFLGFFLFFSSFNIIRGSLTYYVSLILNKNASFVTLVSVALFATSAVFFPITNIMTKKYGLKKMQILDIIIIIVGVLGLVLFKNSNISIIFAFCGIIGMGISGAAFIFPPAMLSEISTDISEKSGISVEGLMFGIQGFFLKLSFMVEAIISISAMVYNSSVSSEGLKTATKEGVILCLIISILMLCFSAIVFSIKKNEI